jgi:uncharacterized protein
MKVHTLQIPVDGKHLEGEDPSSILDLHEESAKPLGPIQYSVDVGLSDGGLFATGRLSVPMQLQCVKCLEYFEYPIEVNEFACQIELTGAEMVDLTEPVREDILLALPAHPHCDWNGQKVCPGAFPKDKETEVPEEPEAEKRAVWGPLDQLKLK